MDTLIQELNSLLEAERAGVEALVGLSVVSPDPLERETLQRIGGEEAWACASLRGQIETLGGTASPRISPLLAPVHQREQFVGGLRAFCRQQRGVLKQVEALLSLPLPEEVHGLLVELQRVHLPNITWCEERAAFAAPGSRREGGPAQPSRKRQQGAQQQEAARGGQQRRSVLEAMPNNGNHAGRTLRPGQSKIAESDADQQQ